MKLHSKISFILALITIMFLVSCSKNEVYEDIPHSSVNLNLSSVPYPKLSDYHFFHGELKNLTPVSGVLPYKPASELFTDYALKKRFIWMPSGVKATYNGDQNILNLPTGSILIKVFYYNNVQPNNSTKIIETRLMIKKESGWIFAEYIWNDQQTEAYLETQSTTRTISWKNENNIVETVDYRTPNTTTECFRCHGVINTTNKFPMGIKPQNLNYNYNYSDGLKNQLTKLIEVGYLENNLPNSIVSTIDYKDTSKTINQRVRSYFDANCAHCHVDGGEASQFDLRFEYNQTIDPVNMGIGVQAEHFVPGYNGRIVVPNNISQSILHYRVNTHTDNFYIMPPLGRSVKHVEGVQLIETWINSL